MEEIVNKGSYEQFRDTLGAELKKQAEGFVKIGYLLKIARDTDILHKSGYNNLVEFAAAEYGLTKDVVSRYIAINDRYSANGYGEQLKEEYQAFGVAKLAEMLTLSDEVIQSLSPELTRKEIQEIKKEIKEEEKITDIEVMMEEKPAERPKFDTLAEEALYQYLKENKLEFEKVYTTLQEQGPNEQMTEEILDAIAPSGVAAKAVRIPGKGKIIISIKGKDEPAAFVNVRTNEKESHDWRVVITLLERIFHEVEENAEAKKAYEILYAESFNIQEEESKLLEEIKEIPEVAPVQPAENKNIVTTEVENKYISTKAEKETDTDPATESPEQEVEKVTGEVIEKTSDLEEIKEISESCTGATKEQVQGQAAIEDYPEYLPEGTKSNMEIWAEIKSRAKARITALVDAAAGENYSLVKWNAQKLVELMEEIR